MTKGAVEDRVKTYRTSTSRAMTKLIKNNNNKFLALNSKVDDAMGEIYKALEKIRGGAAS